MNNQELQNKIEELTNRVDELESMLSVTGMPYDLKEIIRNEVIKSEDSVQAKTEVYSVSGGLVTAPKSYQGTLVFRWKNKEYKIPYIA